MSILRAPRSLRMTFAYDGTLFHGWQRQEGRRTIQAVMEEVLAQVTGEPSVVTASGRTDAGVHALAQVAGFTSSTRLTDSELVRALNAELPDDLFVFAVSPAPENFDPIRHAIAKRYRYLIQDRRVPDLFARSYVWHMPYDLDVAAMQSAARSLLGEHDFQAYETTGSGRLTTVRTVFDIVVERRPADYTERVVIEVEANGFLYNMVRNIVGTLVQVGRGKQSVAWPGEVLATLDRRNAGQTAPAQGLYLQWVKYAE